jgi:hypothetical protein
MPRGKHEKDDWQSRGGASATLSQLLSLVAKMNAGGGDGTTLHHPSTDAAPELRILLSQNTSAGAEAVRA